MKKIITILVLLVAVMFLVGCSGNDVNVVRVASDSGGSDTAVSDASNQAVSDASASTSTSDSTVVSDNSDSSSSTTTRDVTNADLEITSFLLSTLNANPNEEFEVKFKIKNSGTDAISNFEYSVKIMKGNDVVKSTFYDYSGTLPAGGESNKITLTYSLMDKGTYYVTVKADPMDAFEEKNEDNNEAEQTINVIGEITTAPSSSSSSTSSSSSSTSSSTDSTTTSSSSGSCVDTDGGKTYDVKGTCQDDISYFAPFPDFCISSTKIMELYCKDGGCEQYEHTCVCVEGVCES